MDNLTHSLVGLAASKAGLERLSPGMTSLCVLAANAPDFDILTLIGGRWTYLHHHRGLTHSIIGTLALALILPLLYFVGDRLLAHIRNRAPMVRLSSLVLASLLVSATHPLLDWTNNYGVRLLLPWDAQWFYGDLVFIVDPVFWVVLGGAVFLLSPRKRSQSILWAILAAILTYLVVLVSARRGGLDDPTMLRLLWIGSLVTLVVLYKLQIARRWRGKIAIAAFLALGIYCVGLAAIHRVALARARSEAAAIAIRSGESVMDVALMPTLANPLKWQCVVETEQAAYRFVVRLGGTQLETATSERYERADASNTRVVAAALEDERAHIFLNFARYPVKRIVTADCPKRALVQFADLRYTEPGSRTGTFSLELPVECRLLNAESTADE